MPNSLAPSDEGSISGSLAFVAMMQSTDFGQGDNVALLRRLNLSVLGSIFVQSKN